MMRKRLDFFMQISCHEEFLYVDTTAFLFVFYRSGVGRQVIFWTIEAFGCLHDAGCEGGSLYLATR